MTEILLEYGILFKPVEKIQVSLKSKVTGNLHEDICTFMMISV
jgi:hypothetical protein